MIEPDNKDSSNPGDLEVTVRHLREQNAKLLELLRSKGIFTDPPTNQNVKSPDISLASFIQPSESSNISFDHSDLINLTNGINGKTQINQQSVNNYGSFGQQSYIEHTLHGNQSNNIPNFNAAIQSSTQPYVQNNPNAHSQNNTNLTQPINLVNFDNVNVDSIQSIFATQNNVNYGSQSSLSVTTPTATNASPMSSSNSIVNNSIGKELLPSTTHSILSSVSSDSLQNQIALRPKSLLHPHQELVPVVQKIRPEQYDLINRQYSSSSISSTGPVSNESSNLLDGDSNDSKQKHPRPIRPKPSSRNNSLKVYHSVMGNENKVSNSTNNQFNSYSSQNSSFTNNVTNSPTVSLFSSSTCSSPVSTTGYIPQSGSISDHQIDLQTSILNPSLIEMPIPPTNNILSSSSSSCSTANTTITSTLSHSNSLNNLSSSGTSKKSNKKNLRNGKKTSTSSVITSSNSQTPIPIAPNIGRPLAPAPLNVQRPTTANNPITKRSANNKKLGKRQSKTLVQCHSESILQESSSPSNSFADSISGFLENFNQELLESNILSQANDVSSISNPSSTTMKTSNILNDEPTSVISSNSNMIRSLENIDLHNLVNGAIRRQDSFQSMNSSMAPLEERHQHIEQENLLNKVTTNNVHGTQDLNIDNEPISNFMSEEDMRIVEMNFDETTFLKQFDLDDPAVRVNGNSDQLFFNSLLTSTNTSINDLSLIQPQLNEINLPVNPSTNLTPMPPLLSYPGSSLINNNLFTRVVPLGSQSNNVQTSNYTTVTNVSSLLPEEGVQLTPRHIEPRQIATYESAKYQDILDDLVMVTDQDVLNHAQATAADDPSIVSTDFTLALIEAANEIIKDSNLETIEAATDAFNQLQYFYPMEQEQEIHQIHQEPPVQSLIEQQQPIGIQIQQSSDRQLENVEVQQPMVILDTLQSEIVATDNSLTKTVLDDSIINSAITDLSSLLELETISSPQHLSGQSPLINTDKEVMIGTNESETTITTESEAVATSTTTSDLITPIRPTRTFDHDSVSETNSQEVIHIDYDALLPPETPAEKQKSMFDNEINSSYPLISSPPKLPSSITIETTNTNEIKLSTNKPSIIFESILSPTDPKSPNNTNCDEIVVESGCFDRFDQETSESLDQTLTYEDLLYDQPKDPYDLIEEHVQASISMNLPTNDDEETSEDTEMSVDSRKPVATLEETYYRYLHKYKLKTKREKQISSTKKSEQSMTIPPVKLKLKCIFPQKTQKKKKKHQSHSISPERTSEKLNLSSITTIAPAEETTTATNIPKTIKIKPTPMPAEPKVDPVSEILVKEIKQDNDPPVERPRLKITIRTKLPTPVIEPAPAPAPAPAPEPQLEPTKLTLSIPNGVINQEKQELKKMKKVKKKKIQNNNIGQQAKKKVAVEQAPETEYAGLTRFERSLAQRYHQQPTPTLTPNESSVAKPETGSPLSPPSITSKDSQMMETSSIPHSGFLIEEQTPPSSITSVEHRNSPPPLLSTQVKAESLKQNYSHLFAYDNQHDQPNNNTFITPPPEIEFQCQQQKHHNFENFYSHSISPQKKKNLQRKSSVTSSTSSKSLSTVEYAIDTEALEPVSPTPISMLSSTTMSKSKSSSQNPSSCSSSTSPALSMVPSSYLDHSPHYLDHHSHKQSKDHHSSSKKMSSSSRSSKTNLSQPYPTSRSLSNHNYRPPQETPILPPMLPSSIPPGAPPLHLDPYAGSYHHFASRAPPAPFFNFPFPHPFLNPHHTPTPSHYHHHSMKYQHQNQHQHHAHPSHSYPTHQTTFPYHQHLQRQQQYHNPNYMTSRDHHSFDR